MRWSHLNACVQYFFFKTMMVNNNSASSCAHAQESLLIFWLFYCAVILLWCPSRPLSPPGLTYLFVSCDIYEKILSKPLLQAALMFGKNICLVKYGRAALRKSILTRCDRKLFQLAIRSHSIP